MPTLFETFVRELTGPKGLKIVKKIPDKGATDSEIEVGTKLKLSEIRNMLNLLHNCGAVEYMREKNMSSGWYTYTWKKTATRLLQNRLTSTRRELKTLRDKSIGTQGENTFIYCCKQECATLAFTQAAENNFSCPTCKSGLKSVDAGLKLSELEQKVSVLEKVVAGAVAPKTN